MKSNFFIPKESLADINIASRMNGIPDFKTNFVPFVYAYYQVLKFGLFDSNVTFMIQDYDLIVSLLQPAIDLALKLKSFKEINEEQLKMYFLEAGLFYGALRRECPDPLLGHQFLGFEFIGKLTHAERVEYIHNGQISKYIKIFYILGYFSNVDHYNMMGYKIYLGYSDEF